MTKETTATDSNAERIFHVKVTIGAIAVYLLISAAVFFFNYAQIISFSMFPFGFWFFLVIALILNITRRWIIKRKYPPKTKPSLTTLA